MYKSSIGVVTTKQMSTFDWPACKLQHPIIFGGNVNAWKTLTESLCQALCCQTAKIVTTQQKHNCSSVQLLTTNFPRAIIAILYLTSALLGKFPPNCRERDRFCHRPLSSTLMKSGKISPILLNQKGSKLIGNERRLLFSCPSHSPWRLRLNCPSKM